MARRRGGAERKADADEAPQTHSDVVVEDSQQAGEDGPGVAPSNPVKVAENGAQEALPAGNGTHAGESDRRVRGDVAEVESSEDAKDNSDVSAEDNGAQCGGMGADTAEEEGEEEDEEEILVVLELADFKNHPILDDYKSITIEGIDTENPTLHIGEYSLHGQLEETVGTQFFYDTRNRTDKNEYRYVGQTSKKVKFTIAQPDEYP